jgi:hypothetical protein
MTSLNNPKASSVASQGVKFRALSPQISFSETRFSFVIPGRPANAYSLPNRCEYSSHDGWQTRHTPLLPHGRERAEQLANRLRIRAELPLKSGADTTVSAVVDRPARFRRSDGGLQAQRLSGLLAAEILLGDQHMGIQEHAFACILKA